MKQLLAVLLLAVVAVEAVKLPLSKRFWRRPAINQAMIDAINSDSSSTWKAGVNRKFAHMLLADVKHLLGAKRGGPQLPLFVAEPEDDEAFGDDVPTDFDWRTDPLADKCPSLNEIRDQSECGSCWAFGAAEAMTDRICIASEGATQFHVSATDLLACCSSCGDGCDGGYPSAAWDYWADRGVHDGGNYAPPASTADNGCFPYPFPQCEHHSNGSHYAPCNTTFSTPACPSACQDAEEWDRDISQAAQVYAVSANEAAIMAEIYHHGPVEAAFDVYADFLTYTSGVYVHKKGDYLGGHAIKMLGFGALNGTKYWLVANSWNEDWGDHGYFKIARGSNDCRIQDGVVAGIPQDQP